MVDKAYTSKKNVTHVIDKKLQGRSGGFWHSLRDHGQSERS